MNDIIQRVARRHWQRSADQYRMEVIETVSQHRNYVVDAKDEDEARDKADHGKVEHKGPPEHEYVRDVSILGTPTRVAQMIARVASRYEEP